MSREIRFRSTRKLAKYSVCIDESAPRSGIAMKIVTTTMTTTWLPTRRFVDRNPRRISYFSSWHPAPILCRGQREQNGFAAYLVLNTRRLSASRYARGVFTGVNDDGDLFGRVSAAPGPGSRRRSRTRPLTLFIAKNLHSAGIENPHDNDVDSIDR